MLYVWSGAKHLFWQSFPGDSEQQSGGQITCLSQWHPSRPLLENVKAACCCGSKSCIQDSGWQETWPYFSLLQFNLFWFLNAPEKQTPNLGQNDDPQPHFPTYASKFPGALRGGGRGRSDSAITSSTLTAGSHRRLLLSHGSFWPWGRSVSTDPWPALMPYP